MPNFRKTKNFSEEDGNNSDRRFLSPSANRDEVFDYLHRSNFSSTDIKQIFDKATGKKGMHVFLSATSMYDLVEEVVDYFANGRGLHYLANSASSYERQYDNLKSSGIEIFLCDYCGSKQKVQMLNTATPDFRPCNSCGSRNSFSLAASSEKSDIGLATMADFNLKILDVKDYISGEKIPELVASLIEIVLLRRMDQYDLRMWQTRLVMEVKKRNSSFKVPKFPFEVFSSINQNVISDIVNFAKKTNILDSLLSTMQVRGGKSENVVYYDDPNTRDCFCADCLNAWRQSVTGAGLVVVREADVYETQQYEATQIQCKTCNSHNIFYNADFSVNPAIDLERVQNNINEIEYYLFGHFTIDEIRRLMAYIEGDDSIYHEMGAATIYDAVFDLLDYYRKRLSLDFLLEKIVEFKFESQLSGHNIAIQCTYCEAIVATRINIEHIPIRPLERLSDKQVLLLQAILREHCPTISDLKQVTRAYLPNVDDELGLKKSGELADEIVRHATRHLKVLKLLRSIKTFRPDIDLKYFGL